jgi:hypothetical protein
MLDVMGRAVMLVSCASWRSTKVGFVGRRGERRSGEDLKMMLLMGRRWRDLLADMVVLCAGGGYV